MSYSNEHEQLRTRFSQQIGAVPVAWPNVSFTPPNPPAVWVRFTIVDGSAFQTTIGSVLNNHRNVGLVIVQIFAPLNVGNSIALATADTVAAIFRNWCGSTVRCEAASVKDLGPDGQGWYQVNVTIPFKRDELL